MTCFPSSPRTLLAALLLLAGGLAMQAQTVSTTDVPRTISYQGLLTSTDGTPYTDGQYQVTVTLYTNAQGAGAIWQDTYNAQVVGGVFNLYLGAGRPLPGPEMMNAPLWIGTAVNGAEEMRPLTPLTASPYAFNVPDKAITGNKIADNSITAAKLDLDYVSEVQVNGEKVSAKGSVLNLVGTPSVPLSYDEETQSVMIGRTEVKTGDREKGTQTQGTNFDFWTMQGDGRTDNGGIVLPAAGDWIGTSNGTMFDIRTGGISIMRYWPAIDPNIEGGNASVIAAGSQGSTISGGLANNIAGNYDVVGGGNANTIFAGNDNTIGGGLNNNIALGGAAINAATIAGGQNNVVDGPFSTVGGGLDNQIGNFPMSVIGGGANHRINAPEGTIAGGHMNQVNAYVGAITGGHNITIGPNGMAGAIIGGRNNTVDANLGTIGGGRMNNVYAFNDNSMVGGGETNDIGVAGSATGSTHAFLGGGMQNRILPGSDKSVLGGGEVNTIGGATPATHAFLGGGQNNNVTANHATLGGGQGNTVSGIQAVVGGGQGNSATSPISTVGGGGGNVANAPEATIAGGHNNRVDDYVGTIAGGHDNRILVGGNAGFVGGGRMNNVSAASGAIGGGDNNMVSGQYSVVGGGQNNNVTGQNSFIGSGQNNTVSGQFSFIGSGLNNTVTSTIATIGGGGQNTVNGPEGTIAGGHVNQVDAYVGAITGGHNNLITAGGIAGFIGGGRENTATGQNTTIPGGDRLLTDPSYAQTVVGFFNAPRGAAVPFRPAGGGLGIDDPLFIIGNGDIPANIRSNAFEVSYNGHSMVFDVNGTGAVRSAFKGATYTDNVIYAWGDVDPGLNADFGIANMVHAPGSGIYTFTMNYLDPYAAINVLTNIIVTATLKNGYCGFISVTVPGPAPSNTFIIETKDTRCNYVDMPFMFHVTGRQ